MTLKTYSQSNQDDIEHFFEAFEKFQQELALESLWDVKQAKATDVKV